MWFKACQIYAFSEPFAYEPEVLAERLEAYEFKPCSAFQPISLGFAPPLQEEGLPLVHAENQCMLFALQFEEKLLPPSVVRDAVGEKLKDITKQGADKPGRRERDRIKEEVYQRMLPQAFVKRNLLYAYIDCELGLLVVDTTSANQAEQMIDLLRKSLGSLKVVIPQTVSINALMTTWLRHPHHAPYPLTDHAVLFDPNEHGGVIRCQKHDLTDDNIQSFLNDGFYVRELGLEWQDQITFTMREDFSLARIKFLDGVKTQSEEIEVETEREQFAADFIIMQGTLRTFLQGLLHVVTAESHAEAEEAVAV